MKFKKLPVFKKTFRFLNVLRVGFEECFFSKKQIMWRLNELEKSIKTVMENKLHDQIETFPINNKEIEKHTKEELEKHIQALNLQKHIKKELEKHITVMEKKLHDKIEDVTLNDKEIEKHTKEEIEKYIEALNLQKHIQEELEKHIFKIQQMIFITNLMIKR